MADDWELSKEDMDAALRGSAPDSGAPNADRASDAAPPPDTAAAPDEQSRPVAGAAPNDSDVGADVIAEPAEPMTNTTKVELDNLSPTSGAHSDAASIDLLADVDLDVKVELGRCRLMVEDVLRLGPGAVVELDKIAGDPVDVFVNERLVARGEVLVLNDNFCVRINEIKADLSEAGKDD